MKQIAQNNSLSIQPIPKTIISVRDKNGFNNALVVGFLANASLDPVLIMAGIADSRYSHHIVKETGCFVVNYPNKDFSREYTYLGSKSGRDGDKFKALNLKYEDALYIDAPVLTDCPVNIECKVIDSIKPGSHELFIAEVKTIHVDENYLDTKGNILWNKMNLI